MPPVPVRVTSERPLAPNVALVTSVANDKSDNEMILGAEENSGKHQLEESNEEAVRSVISSNGVPSLQMRSVRSQSTSGKVKEGKKERTELDLYLR